MIWISEWLTLGLAFTVAAACVGRRELMAGEVSPVHLPRSLSSGSRFLLVAGQCEMIVSCLSSYSSFDFFNGVCCRQVKPLRTSLLLFSTTLITIPGEVEWHVIIRCQPQLRHRKRGVRSLIIPLPLFQISDGTQGR